MEKLFLFLKKNILTISVIFFISSGIFYWFFWHLKPFTQNAFVFANTRPVSPLVEGFITEIHVRNNEFVKKGTPLFTIFRPPYQLKVKMIEEEIRELEFSRLGIESRIMKASAELRKKEAELFNNKYLSDRANDMYESEAVSQAYAEERLRAMEGSVAEVSAAEHLIEALRSEKMALDARIAKRKHDLSLNQIWEELTVVRAMSDGYITNMSISPGGYYKPGEVLFGFVDTETWWVQANFKESELSEIRTGDKARIWLWQYPGHHFEGVVEGIGWSAERRIFSKQTGLPMVEKENEWFLLPQRFPVQIRILDPLEGVPLHVGGSAYVEIGIPSHPIRQFFWELFLW